MRKFAPLLVGLALLAGCKGLKEQQRPDLVGDNQTKQFYKNVPTNEDKIPSAQRVYFKSQDEAMKAGFSNSQAGSSDSE